MDNRKRIIKALKFAGIIVYLLTTAFLIIMLSAVIADYYAGNKHWQLGGAFALVITLRASIAYIIPVMLGGIGSVISSRIYDKKSKIHFTFIIFVPIVTAIINFITYLIILK